MSSSGPERDGFPRKRLPTDGQYDFAYRPSSYWPDLPGEQSFLSTIKGTQRRDVARRALAGEELERLGDDELYREAMEFVLQPRLDDDERQSWGRAHPSMMGGEYLPPELDDEVEIARVTLASVTGDVIEVRARPSADGIRYRIVDEYWDEGVRYQLSREQSSEPLTLGELIDLLDGSRQEGVVSLDVGVAEWAREFNYHEGDGDPDQLAGFAVVSSAFYPQLEGYYRDRNEEWRRQIHLGCLDEEVEEAAAQSTGWQLLQEGALEDAEQAFAEEPRPDTLGLAAVARRRGDDSTAFALYARWRDEG